MHTLTDWFRSGLLFEQSGSRKELEINIDTITISNNKEKKFLGMWLDQHLTWSTHIQKLTTKLNEF